MAVASHFFHSGQYCYATFNIIFTNRYNAGTITVHRANADSAEKKN